MTAATLQVHVAANAHVYTKDDRREDNLREMVSKLDLTDLSVREKWDTILFLLRRLDEVRRS